MKNFNLKPFGAYLLLEPYVKKSETGVEVPDPVKDAHRSMGRVVAIGPKVDPGDGFKVGQLVCFQHFDFFEHHDGERLLLLVESKNITAIADEIKTKTKSKK